MTNQERAYRLELQLICLKDGLHYADGQAYYKDLNKIRSLQEELARLKTESHTTQRKSA